MINKKNVWFLTLFSLTLVLSIYYVTMPTANFDDITSNDTPVNNEEESINNLSVVGSLNVEDEADVMKEIDSLKEKITSSEVSTNDKNTYFEELKIINKNSSKEETLESKIKEICKCDNFVKIDGSNIRVVLDSSTGSEKNANDIMRLVQGEFTDKKYISVKYN